MSIVVSLSILQESYGMLKGIIGREFNEEIVCRAEGGVRKRIGMVRPWGRATSKSHHHFWAGRGNRVNSVTGTRPNPCVVERIMGPQR